LNLAAPSCTYRGQQIIGQGFFVGRRCVVPPAFERRSALSVMKVLTTQPQTEAHYKEGPALGVERSLTMKHHLIFCAVAALTLVSAPAAAQTKDKTAAGCPTLLQHTMNRLQDGQPQALCQYSGKVLLVVNTASQCGYTPQYKGLEALHAKYAAQGLVVMGFPANDFGQQEPGDAKQISETCFNFYGVRFPMFGKITVKGPGAHPLYAQLTQATGQAPGWNFHKYLVDRQGKVVASFVSDVTPQDQRITGEVEKLLAQR
jgi:glutathione peroxidase